MNNLYARIMPFIMLGIGIVALIFGLIILAYLFFFGAMIGIGLFMVAWVRARFFGSRQISVPKRRGQTINHDE